MTGKLMRVAWLSVLLGVGMEIVLVVVAAGMGSVQGVKPIIADLTQKVSWAVFVCAGLALGTAASKQRDAAMGLAGLIAAPLAFGVARVLHKSAVQALGVASPAPGVPSPLVLALVKAVEYAALGVLLSRLGKRDASVGAYAGTGVLVGMCTSAAVIYLTHASGGQPAATALVVRMVNEIVFPVGCSLVIYASEAFGRSKRV